MKRRVEGSDENSGASDDVCYLDRNSVCPVLKDRSRLTCNGQKLACEILHGFLP